MARRQAGLVTELGDIGKASVERRIYFTLDIDWACDEVLKEAIETFERLSIAATWFVTHNTRLLDRLRENPLFELGIHPNFNFLLDGVRKGPGFSSGDIIDDVLRLVPEARAVRSHSMTQSSRLLEQFNRRGLKFDCNQFVPHQSGIELNTWRHWNGMIRVPYCWEDDVAIAYGDLQKIDELESKTGLLVVDFHPIHLYLNTESLDRYDRCRSFLDNPIELSRCRNLSEFGVRDALHELVRRL